MVDLLHKAYAHGRLDSVEHAERVESAYQAGTLADLAVLHADLAPSAPGPQPGTASKVTAVFTSTRRTGRCVLHVRTIASAMFGRVTPDLREALVPGQANVIVAHAVFGKVTAHVPPGVLALHLLPDPSHSHARPTPTTADHGH